MLLARRVALGIGVAGLLVAFITPGLGVGAANATTKPACTTDSADFPSDSCIVTAMTDDSLTMSFTTTPIYPYCQINGTSQCIYSFFGQFGLSVSGPGTVTDSGSCPDASQNASWTAASDYIGLANGSALACSITFTWDPATQFPLNVAINMTELNGGADTVMPEKDHSFGVTLPPPGPVAEFKATPSGSDPGEFAFTDQSYSLVPQVTITHEHWDSSDGDTGTGATWDHTFDKDGKYDVTLVVTDSNGETGEITHEVNVTTAGSGTSASITVKEALSPHSDQGRFDLYVDSKVVKAKAADGEKGVAHVKPGRYGVLQVATTVGLTHYGVSLDCTKNRHHDFTKSAYAAVVKVSGGDGEVCTFTDTRTKVDHCDVPLLAGQSIAAAKKALRAAHCTVGPIHKPAHSNPAKLVVGHTSPAAFAVTKAHHSVSIVAVVS